MTATTIDFRQNRVAQFIMSAQRGSRALSLNAFAMLACFALCLVLQMIDARELNGANVWLKPGKFFLSLSVHFLTIAWAMSLASPETLRKPSIRYASWGLIVSAWAELAYISFRASQSDASHFNLSTPLNAALYQLMALGSVILVVAAAVIAVVIWRANRNSIWTQSAALGFVLATVLTLIVGFTLGGNASHWIGGDLTDATGLPIFKWSTTGGDLRVSHFISLHVMQIVPFAALAGRRSVVIATALLLISATALTYVQALNGIPLLRV
jgi:hypothetical protein